jgi:hypothetical protein
MGIAYGDANCFDAARRAAAEPAKKRSISPEAILFAPTTGFQLSLE